jgi:O-antigen/teichoic acid export membrane protein
MKSERATSRLTDLRRRVANSRMAALVGSNVSINVIRILGNLVLTRLLSPEMFGAIAIITTIQYVLVMLTDMGFNQFVVRAADGDKKRFLDVIWTARLARNGTLCLLMVALSGPLAAAFGKPELQPGIAAASFVLLVEGFRSMAPLVAERQWRVSYVSAVELAVFVIQTIVVLIAAAVMRDYWAIILSMFVSAVAGVLFSYALFPDSRQRFAFDRGILVEMLKFARFIMPSSAITIVLAQADKVVLGRNLALEQFGLYSLAASLTVAGRNLIYQWGTRMLYPRFSEAFREDPASLKAVFYPMRRRFGMLMAFGCGGLIGGGELLAQILFDPRYLAAGLYISILSAAPLLYVISVPAEMAMVAIGRVQSQLEANICRLGSLAILIPLGLQFGGLLGIVAAFVLMEVPAALYWLWRLRVAGLVDWREEALQMLPALPGAAIGLGATKLAARLIATGVLPPF